ASLDRPVLHRAVRFLDVDVDPAVRVDPLHLRDGAVHFDGFARIEFGGKRMMRERDGRRCGQREARPDGECGQLSSHVCSLWLYLPNQSYSFCSGGPLRVTSTIIVSPSQCLTSGCLRRFPYMNSSTKSMHW